jgi:hypothetical protein
MGWRKDITCEKVLSLLDKYGNVDSIADRLKCCVSTVRHRLKLVGIEGAPSRNGKARTIQRIDWVKCAVWRRAVFHRDGAKCRICESREKITAHHIRRWVDRPDLRFVADNGITLCHDCHLCTYGKEKAFELLFDYMLAVSTTDIPETDTAKTVLPESKKCTLCGVTKKASEFTPRKASADGLYSWCKECNREANRNKYHRKREACLKATHDWYAGHKEYRYKYASTRMMNEAIAEGRFPNWTRGRARVGLVPKDKNEWPTKEVIARVQEVRDRIGLPDIPISSIPDIPIRSIPDKKYCSRCGNFLPLDAFRPARGGGKYGKSALCQECERERSKIRYWSHRQKYLDYSKEYDKNNSERKKYKQRWGVAKYMEKQITAGVMPQWTKLRAALGLVPENPNEWPTQDVINRIAK